MSIQSATLERAETNSSGVADAGFREFAESLVQNIDQVFFWRETASTIPYFVTDAFERIFGLPCSSVYENPSAWVEAIHPEDRERALREQMWPFAAGKMASEYRIIRPDGEIRWISVRLFAKPSGARRQILVGIAQDCTERIRAEEAQEFLAAIVRSSEEGIVGTDWDGTILSWNRGAEKLFGYDAAEALGRNITFLVPPDDVEASLAILNRTKNGEETERYEAVRLAKGGRPIDVSVVLSPVKNRREQGIGVSASYRDIFEQKRIAAQLLQAKLFAEEASRSKSEFLANMSHEIRTPMNGVIGIAEVLLDTELSEEQREYVEIMQYSATSLLTIINDILDFSKIEAKKLTLEAKHFRLREVLASVLREMEIHANKHDLVLTSSIGDDVPEIVLGDAGRLRQVLVNLINNGIKFTRRGRVSVGVSSTSPGSDTLQFDVKDTGPGIPLDKQQSIFDPFVQAGSSGGGKPSGTGLGLTISSRLVAMMNGRIWLDSSERGSNFHFTAYLPTVADE